MFAPCPACESDEQKGVSKNEGEKIESEMEQTNMNDSGTEESVNDNEQRRGEEYSSSLSASSFSATVPSEGHLVPLLISVWESYSSVRSLFNKAVPKDTQSEETPDMERLYNGKLHFTVLQLCTTDTLL